MHKKYSYGKQLIDNDDIESVLEVLKGDFITQGPKISDFENALRRRFGSKYVSVVSNGTAALHLAALALKWDKEDTVITIPMTFVACANCALYVGANIDFVDIDSSSYTIDVDQLEDKLKNYKSAGKKVSAVIAVDFAGHPCDWKSLSALADKYKFQLIDDACHAMGAMYDGKDLVSSAYPDLTILSFHPVKHITAAEGGAILTNDIVLDKKLKVLRTHGITKDPEVLSENHGSWYYEMQDLGYNYRISDIHCALGKSQLKKLDRFLERRREIALFYDEIFKNDDRFIIPKCNDNVLHAYHLYPLQIKFDSLTLSKTKFFENLKQKNIFCQVHYIPIHMQPFYQRKFGFKIGDYPVSEEFYKREVSIPMYPSLEEEDLKYITDTIFESI